MKKNSMLMILLGFLITYSSAWSLKIKETEKIQKSLKFSDPLKPKSLFIDNIFGSINIIGTNANEVKIKALRTIKGRTRQKIENAKKEVNLEISEKDNALEIFVDGPFRYPDNTIRWNCEKSGYTVQYDFEIHLPHKTDIFLKTVNNGDIAVQSIEGNFLVENVNGKISISGISGSGNAHTVNGEVKILFNKNPLSDCSFRTLNGDIELSFPQKPSADFMVKTYNGDIYSAFEVTTLPSTPVTPIIKNGRFSYRSNRFQGIRIGKGGPQIRMNTFNGDILIAKK